MIPTFQGVSCSIRTRSGAMIESLNSILVEIPLLPCTDDVQVLVLRIQLNELISALS